MSIASERVLHVVVSQYSPSYLVLGRAGPEAFHVVVAVGVEGDNVRVVTAYRPDAGGWQDDLKIRRPKR
jgi:hypothetical protein